jgi:hypothetical protein
MKKTVIQTLANLERAESKQDYAMKAIEAAQKHLEAGKILAQKDSKKDNVYALNVEFERKSNEGHEASTEARKCLCIIILMQ